MGRIVTPKYRVEACDNTLDLGYCRADSYIVVRGRQRPAKVYAWRGRVSAEKLEEWRKASNASYLASGCNAHISKALGVVPHISHARIVEQRTGRIVAQVDMPMFEAM